MIKTSMCGVDYIYISGYVKLAVQFVGNKTR